MLRSLVQRQVLLPLSRVRCYSAAAHTPTPPSANPGTTTVRHPYFVPRSAGGNLPVYTDIRNTKYLVLIRNVEGNIASLVKDLSHDLFPAGSPEAERLKIATRRDRHVVIQGGKWKSNIVNWLQEKGF
ncbi:hypothetical protein K474DRAFT_1658522 [Panus rudis PR-1116 ss-1]|nr:hypothetical protein K474DRAFT_1658522 [Panus rudis PR-1116 ss-1]